MATACVGESEDTTDCQVCFETYKEPKLLPCGHLLCLKCLSFMLKRDGKKALCPFCRQSVVSQPESKSLAGANKEVEQAASSTTSANASNQRKSLSNQVRRNQNVTSLAAKISSIAASSLSSSTLGANVSRNPVIDAQQQKLSKLTDPSSDEDEPTPESEKLWESFAKQLPTDMSMVALIEERMLLAGNTQCTLCESAAATFYCLICSEG